ncbi:hypothetical protein RvY_14866 [Ramazzottius varieornatus]|uniref:Uncharacterized protein n=1 Tax=Ramazzottius varieornatus TaxID=947166 RepID=A0A1D1VZZ0_RAMVA|nr:hypothetical protein RvY_14866 [Ramazzottius varieornatus]
MSTTTAAASNGPEQPSDVSAQTAKNVLSSAEHTHVANANETEAGNAKAALRERVRQSLIKPRRLFSDLVQNIPIEVNGHLPSAHIESRGSK